MEALKEQVKDHDRRIRDLENHREHDIQLINENNKNLAVIINKLENIAESMKTLTNNWKEAIERSNSKQREENQSINARITSLENDTEKLTKKLDERTILKDSNSYQKYIFEIIKYVMIAIIGFLGALFLRK